MEETGSAITRCSQPPRPDDSRSNRSPAAVAGPGLAGLLVQALGTAAAPAADAVSYLWSAVWPRRIETPDTRPEPRERRLLREIGEGLRLVRGDRVLLAISAHGAVSSFFQSAHLAIVVVFLARDVGLSPWVIGVLGTASLTGALTARWLGDAGVPASAAIMVWSPLRKLRDLTPADRR
ncbi:MFS transporter [Amycolatopsis sp. CA-126428]|uniref:MFS transporter n=1 Tax=Amycolatopsis sp. CA-126428 TaxID=2073158 RepID=UPI001E5DCC00|nr:MFS transporter [Amycolatopsis sp. CA-126428]